MHESAETRAFAQVKSAFFNAIFSDSILANFVRIVAALFIAGVVALNFSHSLHTFASLGAIASFALASLFAFAGIIGPAAMHAILSAGSITRGAICAVTGLACLAICLLVNIGATSSGRGDAAARRSAEITAYKALTEKRLTVSNEILELNQNKPRDAHIVQVDIDAGGKVPVEVLARSAGCTDVTLEKTRRACEPLIKLRSELAASNRMTALGRVLSDLDAKLAAMKPPAEADSQAAELTWMASKFGIEVESGEMAKGTNALTAILLELIAALSLSVATIIEDAHTRRKQRDALPRIVVADEVPTPAVAPLALQQHTPAVPTTRPSPMVPSEQRVLTALRESRGVLRGTHRTIARDVGMPASTLSAAVRHLAERGAVIQRNGFVELVGLRVVGAAA